MNIKQWENKNLMLNQIVLHWNTWNYLIVWEQMINKI